MNNSVLTGIKYSQAHFEKQKFIRFYFLSELEILSYQFPLK